MPLLENCYFLRNNDPQHKSEENKNNAQLNFFFHWRGV